MAAAPKSVIKGVSSKHSQSPGSRAEIQTVAAGTVGGGSPSKEYSNRGAAVGSTEYRSVEAAKGNK